MPIVPTKEEGPFAELAGRGIARWELAGGSTLVLTARAAGAGGGKLELLRGSQANVRTTKPIRRGDTSAKCDTAPRVRFSKRSGTKDLPWPDSNLRQT
jgi:hypothetical protein